MATIMEQTSGRDSAREVLVWDPLVRMIHWLLALSILVNGFMDDPESKLHEWIGFVALGLVGIRLVWALVGPKHARFTAFPPNPQRGWQHVKAVLAGDRTVHLSHNPLGALMVYNIWLTVLAIGVSGYMMTTISFFGVDWVEELHETLFGWLLFSIALHLAGVLYESWRSGVNLVRAMIDGRKRIPTGRDVR